MARRSGEVGLAAGMGSMLKNRPGHSHPTHTHTLHNLTLDLLHYETCQAKITQQLHWAAEVTESMLRCACACVAGAQLDSEFNFIDWLSSCCFFFVIFFSVLQLMHSFSVTLLIPKCHRIFSN